ncbi:hypothetical protein [Fodinicola acaciae]|nr:hypothetical protein [Fodinicola acaciae]
MNEEAVAAADAADRAYQTESPAGQDPPDDDVSIEAPDVNRS